LTRRKTLSIIIAFAVCVGIVLAPTPAELTREGQNALAIFALCFVLWVGNALPLAVTSLFAIVFSCLPSECSRPRAPSNSSAVPWCSSSWELSYWPPR
jgi:di/tricarboxylate transporter